MSKRNDLQQDWPTDPQNEELARLAEQLTDAAPALAPDALGRVQARLDAALNRARRGRRFRILAWSAAAAVLLGMISYAAYYTGGDWKRPVTPPAFVQDRLNVAFSESTALPDAGKPLVPLDEYRSLFAD